MYRAQKGFTLVKSLIVITITAVMTVVTFPNMNQWVASRRTASQAEQIANLLRSAQNEVVRLNLPVCTCLVEVKSDGSPSNSCDSKCAGNGMSAYVGKDGGPNYKSGTADLSVHSIILNGDIDKVECSFDYTPISNDRSTLSASTSKEVWWRLLPNGISGHSADDKNYQFSDGHVKVSLMDKSAAGAETKKACATVLLVDDSGHVEICAKSSGRKTYEYTSE